MQTRCFQRSFERYKNGEIALDDAAQEIEGLRLERVGDFACLDLGRAVRCGMPEVILAEGKDPEHLAEIAVRYAETAGRCVVTRVTPEQVSVVQARCTGKGITAEYPYTGTGTCPLDRSRAGTDRRDCRCHHRRDIGYPGR